METLPCYSISMRSKTTLAQCLPANMEDKIIVDFITRLCSNTFDTIIKVPEHRLNRLIQFSAPSRYSLRCNRRIIVPKCKTDRFRNTFIIRSCIDNIYTKFVSPFIFFYTFIFTVFSFYIHFISYIICKYAIQPSGYNVLLIKLSIYLSIYRIPSLHAESQTALCL